MPKEPPDEGEKDAMAKLKRRFVDLLDPILEGGAISAEDNSDVEAFRLQHGVSDFWFDRFLEEEFDSSKEIYDNSLEPELASRNEEIMQRIGTLGVDLSGFSRRKKKVQRRESYALILGGTVADGSVHEDEAAMLQRCQMILGITNAEHLKALSKLGWSEERFYERGSKGGASGRQYAPDRLVIVKMLVHKVEHTKKRSKLRNTHRKVTCRLEQTDGSKKADGRRTNSERGKRRKSVADEDIKTTMQNKILGLEPPSLTGMDPVFDFLGQLPVPLFESAVRSMFLHVELVHDHQQRSKEFETPLGKIVVPVSELMDDIFPEAAFGTINSTSVTHMIGHCKKFDLQELQNSNDSSGSEQLLFTFVAEPVGKEYLRRRMAVENDVNTRMMLNEVRSRYAMAQPGRALPHCLCACGAD